MNLKTVKYVALSFFIIIFAFGSSIQIVLAQEAEGVVREQASGDVVSQNYQAEQSDEVSISDNSGMEIENGNVSEDSIADEVVGSEETKETETEQVSSAENQEYNFVGGSQENFAMPLSLPVPAFTTDLSCKITSPEQTGWYGTYFNYNSATPGMELPDSQWRVSFGDPLSDVIAWTANWYDQTFARFSRVDSTLVFGDNFFPFDSSAEEIINGHDYHFGVHWSANIMVTGSRNVGFTLKSDDDTWLYVNGVLVADNSGVHPTRTINGVIAFSSGANKVDIYFAERHTTASYMSFSLDDNNLIIKPFSENCPPPSVNTPPVITLVGPTVSTTTIGVPFVESGAIAKDAEDGDISSRIVVTGTVDYLTVGTYVLTYSVTDSGGLSDSVVRTVNVADLTPPSNGTDVHISASKIVCNSESDLPNWGQGGPNITASTAIQFLETHPNCRLESGFKFQWATAEVPDPGKDFINEASGWNTFGPTNSSGVATATASVSSEASYIWVREVLKDGYLPFSYPGDNNPYSAEMYCHIDVLNYDNYDKINSPWDPQVQYYCVAFNVLKETPPPTNTPPVITLTGDNPIEIVVDSVFVDPGATATDLEDGDLTANIVRTGAVIENTVGTYVLVYTVTDSKGLSTTTTRTVIVKPKDIPPPADHVSVSLSASPNTIIVGNSTTLSWNSTNADSCSAPWTIATSTSGTQLVYPSATSEYSISCVGETGSASATTTITVNPVNPPTPPSNGGGGGGIGGRRHDITALLSPKGEILGATSCVYLRDFLKIGWQNDPVEVLKLQSFLNQFEDENLSLTGVFDEVTFMAVSRFQNKYFNDILAPWGHDSPTGFVYILTKKKVNEIYCNTVLSLNQNESDEISNFRSLMERNSGAGIKGAEVGVLPSSGSKSSVLSDVLRDANVSNSNGAELEVVELEDDSKVNSVIRNAAVSLFAVPQKMLKDTKYLLLSIIALLVVIGVMIKLFGSSKKRSKEASEIIAAANKIAKEKTVTAEESPVIILPGVNNKKEEILPDEEIIISNEEEEIQDIK